MLAVFPQAGNSLGVADTGYFTAHYVSSLDDSQQPFALWVPRTYSARKKYPLLVMLHGSDADHRMIPEQCWRMHERGFSEQVIALSPFGRGDTDFCGPGEADIWDAIKWVKARYRIDATRQYLTGLSLGGYATWHLACEYPEQWAAIAPVCGGGEISALPALKKVPVWCVHGERDDIVPPAASRKLAAELARLKFPHRHDEVKGWGHNVWEWLYDPDRTTDSLVSWLLKHRKRTAPAPVPEPHRTGTFHDLFSARVIISHPARTPIPRETEVLRSEAERAARFTFGDDIIMRTGRLIVKPDNEVTPDDLREAHHLMLGRTDNHALMKKAERKLMARHVKGTLRVAGETYLGKTLLAATCQPSPWNSQRLLGIITYQQFSQMRGITDRLVNPRNTVKNLNLFDTQQKRFILQSA